MKDEDRMTIDERWKYLRIKQKRYLKANRTERSRLLDEMEEVTGLHRKSVIRLINGDLTRKPREKQRGRTYGVAVYCAIGVIAESRDYICAERLQPRLAPMAEQLASHGELEVTPELLAQLESISVSTVKRIRRRQQQDEPQLQRGKPASKEILGQVTVRTIPWDEVEPGHFEVDLVHHCGPNNDGHYIHSLQMIDVATGWSERAATLGRSYRVMRDAFGRIVERCPLPILEIHSDNGSEFLQHHMIRFWQEEVGGVTLSRGRPYRKNDQRFVEQKNSTLVRNYLGYERLDTVVQTNFLNRLYEWMGIYYNLFQPVMRMVEKEIVQEPDGSTRTKRRYDEARTPFERLCETGVLDPTERQRWERLYEQTNPRQLRLQIYRWLDQLCALPSAKAGKTEDIFDTLLPAGRAEPELWICGQLSPSSDLPTYPQLLRLSEGKNGKSLTPSTEQVAR
jgi:transposase InsO family protein